MGLQVFSSGEYEMICQDILKASIVKLTHTKPIPLTGAVLMKNLKGVNYRRH